MKKTKFALELLVVIVLVFCLILHSVGTHDIDNSLNALKTSYDNQDNDFYSSCDRTALGQCYSYTNLYMLGQVIVSISNMILAFDFVGLFFMYLYKDELNKLK